MQDTFYLVDRTGEQAAVKGESAALLRTQTSGVQGCTMEENKPPIYIIAPGRCIAATSPTRATCPSSTRWKASLSTRGISFGDLKGTLDYFCKQMFGPDRKDAFPCALLPVHRAFCRGLT